MSTDSIIGNSIPLNWPPARPFVLHGWRVHAVRATWLGHSCGM